MATKQATEVQTTPLTEPSSLSDASPPPTHGVKPWNKPGFVGSTRRALRTVQRYVWDDPDKPAEEKWFLLKLDIFLLSSSCLGYFSKNLDQSNIGNAYVSGMKEALGMHGSELTYAGNVFTAGYVIGQMPAVMLASRVRPSILIPSLEIMWSVLTLCLSSVTNVSQLYAIRFLIGLCESGYFPVMIYLVSSWYTKEERGKRVALFYSTASFAHMFSGYLQAGAYNGLDGVHGKAGWQWLFIVCGVISLPIAFVGYFFIPDFPETTRAFYITKEEAERQCKRLVAEGQKPLGHNPWTVKKLLVVVKQWQFWVLPLGYFFVQGSFPNQQPVMALWLKAEGHTVYQRNVWPTGQTAVGVVVQILAGMLGDSLLKGRRWPVIIAMQAGTLFSSIVLAAWTVPETLKYVAYYFLNFSAGVPGPYFAWYSDLIPHDHEMRGFVIAVSNMFSYIMSIWYTIAVWRTADGPRFKPGFIAASVLGVCMMVLCLVLRLLQRRDETKRAQEDRVVQDIETPAESKASSEVDVEAAGEREKGIESVSK
ncbi:putative pantothenate transporter [Dothidotthia symphoricarpi CBS 119687]|uniref:Putative pantothenate transporter n=1 Tax=Dothidotthia symphoricarpi CBS 119687 TaxID=1392245 RepID=A0A6A6ALP5_9PLEO|nr:putative pantothenate transporter [Dothidotthia symphoricarpi CBS 119687]KAF2131807.1 putative pantothenate transporter [Dothidotthia symphoricarpi CBS 119687]